MLYNTFIGQWLPDSIRITGRVDMTPEPGTQSKLEVAEEFREIDALEKAGFIVSDDATRNAVIENRKRVARAHKRKGGKLDKDRVMV